MRKTFLLAACTAAALALAGCGGSTAGTAAPAPGAAAPAPVAQITTIDQLSDAISKSTQGKTSASMSMNMSVGGQSITGEGAYAINGSDVKMQLTLTVPQMGAMEMRLIDRVMYVKNSQPNAKWLKMPVDPNDPRTAQFSQIIDQVDVTKQFDQFKSISTMKGKAEEPVDGAPATRYDIAVDMSKAAAAATTPAEKEQIEQLQQSGVQNVDMQLWLDQANLPIQYKTAISAQGQAVTVLVKLKNWGEPVTVTAPPADQITELPKGN
ncbi:hypothetical protein ACQEVB_10190 [Pseudonocardia sp. CA-107938]|uniref:hypothetical protein n=1 Tax=Pseudonocardia sp. CA-107938 TaxID=3240021 RepID=UPI003D8C4C6A